MYSLTEKCFEDIMTGLVKDVLFEPMLCSGFLEPLKGKYIIHISSYENNDIQKISLVHEVEHIRRDTEKVSEEDIETEAKIFIKNHPNIVERYYKKYYEKHVNLDIWRKADEWMKERSINRQYSV